MADLEFKVPREYSVLLENLEEVERERLSINALVQEQVLSEEEAQRAVAAVERRFKDFKTGYISGKIKGSKEAAAKSGGASLNWWMSLFIGCLLAIIGAVLFDLYFDMNAMDESKGLVKDDPLLPFETTSLDMVVLSYYTTYYNPPQLRMQRRSLQGYSRLIITSSSSSSSSSSFYRPSS
jgi:hypothetical protein